ncbi:TIGR04211 family SH3 domain-containing protein [Agaribacter flavus]|uniref:TIGR04211 family SH3 domain-containing protein n=1 Tax=Agaribacter flavus TaxID=1902781 RepID=A0ABV7FPC9_9ALTE
MRLTLLLLLLFLCSTTIAQVDTPNDETSADTRFISDDLFIYMHAGPGRDFRLLGSIEAGTEIKLVQVDQVKGFAEIVDPRERRGWVESKFVSRKPSIRQQMSNLQSLLDDKQKELEQKQKELSAIKKNLAQSSRQKAKLNRQITQHLEELSSLKQQIQKQERQSNMQWFTRGTVLALISVVVGYLMGMYGRRKNKSEFIS